MAQAINQININFKRHKNRVRDFSEVFKNSIIDEIWYMIPIERFHWLIDYISKSWYKIKRAQKLLIRACIFKYVPTNQAN